MARLKVTVRIQGRPAVRLYVQHIWSGIGFSGPIDLYITDDDGQVRDEHGKVGINTNDEKIDIRILAQNPVARMVNLAAVWPVYTDEKVKDGAVVNITTEGDQLAHFLIVEMAMNSYERVHRHFEPFLSTAKEGFPFGRRGTLEDARESNRRIDIVYPDNLPQQAPFVEPTSMATHYPLMHLKDKRQARNDGGYDSYNRLFGFNGQRPEIVPHELAHAIHFTLLPATKRKKVQDDYVKFLVGRFISDGDASHSIDKHTNEMVAYLEAFGAFSERAYAFVAFWAKKHNNPQVLTTGFDASLASEFIEAETQNYANPDEYYLKGDQQIAKMEKGHVVPRHRKFTSREVEGAVYAAIFLDFANETSMAEAMEAFNKSAAINFREFEVWVIANWPGKVSALDDVKGRWF